jgi:Ca2+-transporting ATPase
LTAELHLLKTGRKLNLREASKVETTKYKPLCGLTSTQVLEQRRKHGENVLPSTKGPSAWIIFFGQFKNPLVYIILVAAAVSLAVGEYGDFAIIMAVVVLDAILGFVQEYRAQRTIRHSRACSSQLQP